MKKFFPASFFILILIFAFGQKNFVQAEDYYLGVYEDGSEGYLVSETIKYYREYKNDYIISEGYNCSVKAVKSNGNIQYISYKYQASPQTIVLYKNGVMYHRQEFKRILENKNHPEAVLVNILDYIWKENIGY